MQISKSKSVVKNETKIDVSARQEPLEMSCIVIAGCELLWIPHWPPSSKTQQPTVMDYVNTFRDTLKERLSTGNVYLVFDSYEDFSTLQGCPEDQMAAECFSFAQHCPCHLRSLY